MFLPTSDTPPSRCVPLHHSLLRELLLIFGFTLPSPISSLPFCSPSLLASLSHRSTSSRLIADRRRRSAMPIQAVHGHCRRSTLSDSKHRREPRRCSTASSRSPSLSAAQLCFRRRFSAIAKSISGTFPPPSRFLILLPPPSFSSPPRSTLRSPSSRQDGSHHRASAASTRGSNPDVRAHVHRRPHFCASLVRRSDDPQQKRGSRPTHDERAGSSGSAWRRGGDTNRQRSVRGGGRLCHERPIGAESFHRFNLDCLPLSSRVTL